MKSDWVNCPICGSPDMRRLTDDEGNVLINCTNHACRSNGGTYDQGNVRTEVQYTDKELLDWVNDGDEGNLRDNLESVDYQILHCDKWDIRKAIAACLKHSKENQI
jgi:hypothetical protein